MINTAPANWDYNQSLELLFMFFQSAEEMLDSKSFDTYRVPVHNSITLCREAKSIYGFLHSSKQIDRFYSKYIPPIIDELVFTIGNDSVLKKHLGKRLDCIITGLNNAKSNPTELVRWIDLISHSCSPDYYITSLKNRIIETVIENKNKNDLISLTRLYLTSLISVGYSMKYLQQTIYLFFNNRDKRINNPECIKEILDIFTCASIKHEMLFVADSFLIDYYSSIEPSLNETIEMTVLREADIFVETKNSIVLRNYYETYNRLKHTQGRPDIKMIKCITASLDPYGAREQIYSYFDLLHCFEGYFKHKIDQKRIFHVIYKNGTYYTELKPLVPIPNRPFLSQDIIDKRIGLIFNHNNVSQSTIISLLNAIRIHFDAINCKRSDSMLRTFWIALETLFFDSSKDVIRENVIYGLIHIVQKTYLLKLLRIIYYQLKEALQDNILCDQMGINDFESFLLYFSKYEQDEAGFKEITKALSNNPLLRSRVYNLRKELRSSDRILKKLELHRDKVFWHISRIYRTRNLSTHSGVQVSYTDEILYNMHNYFDYAVNFLLCKIENSDYISSISALVFEAKNDNSIHIEMLKDKCNLNESNYLDLLFGPDHRLEKYRFEAT